MNNIFQNILEYSSHKNISGSEKKAREEEPPVIGYFWGMSVDVKLLNYRFFPKEFYMQPDIVRSAFFLQDTFHKHVFAR